MERFFVLHKVSGKTDAEVLQAAMAETRSKYGWKNPYHWGAFQLTGLPII